MLTDFGGVLIFGKKPFLKYQESRHDAWPYHGYFQGWRYYQGASGIWYWGAYFFLKDGSSFWYPGYKGADESAVYLDLFFDTQEPMPPDFKQHLGEAYNFVIRPKTFDKVLDENTAAWILVN
jgi:hypothetical protein